MSRRNLRSRVESLLGSFVAVILLGSLAAAEESSQEWPLSSNGFVEIHQPEGGIRVTGWDREVVSLTSGADLVKLTASTKRQFILSVTASPDSALPMIDIRLPASVMLEIEGRRLAVEVSQMTGVVDVRAESADVKVDGSAREVALNIQSGSVEASTNRSVVKIQTVAAMVTLRATGGRADISTVSGGIFVVAEGVDARLKSVSGDLLVTGSRSRIQAESGSGMVEVEWKDGDVEVSTVTGAITATGDRFNSGRLESFSGNIRFASALGSAGNLDVRAHQGSVDVNLIETGGDVFVSTETGAIRVKGDGFVRGRLESEAGNIRFEGAVESAGALDVTTKGRVELVVPRGLDANYRIESGGQILNAFGPASSSNPPGRSLAFTNGNGGAWISVTTEDDVHLSERDPSSRAISPGMGDADSAYETILKRIGSVDAEESIRGFEALARSYPAYAPAHHQLGLLYMSRQTIRDRQRAERALIRAMQLDPGRAQYQRAWGDLLWSQGFWYNSGRHYQEMLEENPGNAAAAYGVGRQAFREFLTYVDRGRKWLNEAQAARTRAVEYLSKAIELDPGLRLSYYDLGRLYLEKKQPDGLVRVGGLLLKRYPDDKDALLFTALGYQLAADEKKAAALYAAALKRMGPQERRVMEAVDLIATEEEAESIGTWGEWAAGFFGRTGENPDRTRFWRKQDPLYLTDYNERRMEHYGRVAFANLAYGQPSHGIPGWQTDMGKTFIKFGRYVARSASHRGETWIYEGFSMSFQGDGLERWSFSTQSAGSAGGDFAAMGRAMQQPPFTSSWSSGGLGYASSYAQVSHAARSEVLTRLRRSSEFIKTWSPETSGSSSEKFQSKSPRYVDPYRLRKYPLPHQVARFRADDGVRLEIAYGLPLSKIQRDAKDGFVHLEEGIFMFDEKWDEVKRHVEPVFELGAPADDGPMRDYLLVEHTSRAMADVRHVSIETRDMPTGSIGVFRTQNEPLGPDSTLVLSDLLLASEIELEALFPKTREQLKIRPNPLRIYVIGDPIQLYFETYGLARDTFGRTRYTVSYRIGWPKPDDVDPTLFPELNDLQIPDEEQFVQVEAVREMKSEELRLGDDEGGRMAELIRSELSRPGRIVDYKVTYVTRKPKVFEFGPPRDKQVWATTVTAEYEGDLENDLTYLAIDASDASPGVHELTVIVQDMVSKQTAERRELFRLVE